MGEIQVRLIFTLNFIYQRHHHGLELRNLHSLQLPYLQKYEDAVARKGAPLYNCFDFVGGTIACICIPVLNEMVVYSHDTKVHGIKFRTVVLPNGLIINLEGQWEGRRHYCLLSFMNRVYKLSQLSGWHTESSKGFERKPFRVLRMIKNH